MRTVDFISSIISYLENAKKVTRADINSMIERYWEEDHDQNFWEHAGQTERCRLIVLVRFSLRVHALFATGCISRLMMGELVAEGLLDVSYMMVDPSARLLQSLKDAESPELQFA